MGDNLLDQLLQLGDEVVELQQVGLIEYVAAAEAELQNLLSTGG